MSYEQTIYNRLRQGGLTEAAALGMLGNWKAESGNEPYRLQGDFSAYRTMSKAYVQSATNGSMSKSEFCKAVGFGLAQWTYPARKANLWDWWKASGKALDSAEMQTDFAMHELQTEYRALLEFLKSTNDIFTATSRICREYERPAVNNIDARFQNANSIKYEIDLNGWQDDPEPEPEPTPAPKPDKIDLRTIDKNCSGFDEVMLLKALLLLRGYTVQTADCFAWEPELTECVIAFQRHHGLQPDGVVGQRTWSELLKRGEDA